MIIHKYIVGDTVMFNVTIKGPFANRSGTTARISGLAPALGDEPYYYLEGETRTYPESCFSGRYER